MLHPEKLPIWFIEEPDRIVGAGTFVFFLAALLAILAAYAKILLLASSATLFAAQKYLPTHISELNLSWPTWFVAESWIGYLCIGLLAALGLYTINYGRQIKRIMASF